MLDSGEVADRDLPTEREQPGARYEGHVRKFEHDGRQGSRLLAERGPISLSSRQKRYKRG